MFLGFNQDPTKQYFPRNQTCKVQGGVAAVLDSPAKVNKRAQGLGITGTGLTPRGTGETGHEWPENRNAYMRDMLKAGMGDRASAEKVENMRGGLGARPASGGSYRPSTAAAKRHVYGAGFQGPESQVVNKQGAFAQAEPPARVQLGKQGTLEDPLVIIPKHVKYDKKVLRLFGYYREQVMGHSRVRKVVLLYYLEDDTIQVDAPREPNSGIQGGTLHKRMKIPVENKSDDLNNNGFIDMHDMNVREFVTIYGKTIRIVDCDKFTREYIEKELGKDCPPPEEYPVDKDPPKPQDHRSQGTWFGRNSGAPRDTWTKQFLQHDREVLRFKCVWDDSNELFGGRHHYILHYYLADDTIEILEAKTSNSGKDSFPKLLNRMKLSKDVPGANVALIGHQTPKNYYKDSDLRVGSTLKILNRELYIYDADDYTKNHYRKKYGMDFNMAAVEYEEEMDFGHKEPPQRPVPPPTAVAPGHDADSLGTTKYLMNKPPKKDFFKMIENDKRVLRYSARLDTSRKADIPRQFVISVYLADDTVAVFEKERRNSGAVGGQFLKRQEVRKPGIGSELYRPCDFFVGAMIELNRYRFILTEGDVYTYKYMEDHPKIWPLSDVGRVHRKAKDQILSRHHDVGNIFANMDTNQDGYLDANEFMAFLQSCGLQLSGQEFITLMRAYDYSGDGKVSMDEFKQSLVNLPPETKEKNAWETDEGRGVAAGKGGPRPSEKLVRSMAVKDKVKEQLRQKGGHGLRGLQRLFRKMDTDGNRWLTEGEMKFGLREYGIEVTDAESVVLAKMFDLDGDNHISFDEFLEAMRDPMSRKRMEAIQKVFTLLDKDSSGALTIQDFQSSFSTANHPDVVAKRKTPDQVLSEFIRGFEGDGQIDGKVTFKEFSDYYGQISAGIEDDQYFLDLLNKTWRLDGTKRYLKGSSKDAQGGLVGAKAFDLSEVQGHMVRRGRVDPSSPEAERVLKKVRAAVKRRGSQGIKALGRMFRIMDDDDSKSVSRDEFKYGLRDFGVQVTEGELNVLCNVFDVDGDGKISFDEFLVNVREPLNRRRLAVIHKAFAVLDKDGSGVVDFRDMVGHYDVSANPDVANGRKTQRQALEEFLGQFEKNSSTRDGKVSIEEFIDYYRHVSASIDRDDYFLLMMQNAWKIDPASLTAIRAENSAEDAKRQKRIAFIEEKIRRAFKARGGHGIKSLGRLFRIMDDDNSRRLNKEEFKYGLKDMGLPLDDEELDLISDAYDTDGDGSISFDEFLVRVRDPLPADRLKWIKAAFNKMDRDGSGVITYEDLKGVYNAKFHPDFLDGKKTEQQVLTEFLHNFEKNNDGVVTLDEFTEYYAAVSASIDRDDYFELMIRRAWKLEPQDLLKGPAGKERPPPTQRVDVGQAAVAQRQAWSDNTSQQRSRHAWQPPAETMNRQQQWYASNSTHPRHEANMHPAYQYVLEEERRNAQSRGSNHPQQAFERSHNYNSQAAHAQVDQAHQQDMRSQPPYAQVGADAPMYKTSSRQANAAAEVTNNLQRAQQAAKKNLNQWAQSRHEMTKLSMAPRNDYGGGVVRAQQQHQQPAPQVWQRNPTPAQHDPSFGQNTLEGTGRLAQLRNVENKVRNQLKQTSSVSLLGLRRIFKIIDASNSGRVTRQELSYAFQDANVILSMPELQLMCDSYDIDGENSIVYEDVLRTLRDPMSEDREALVRRAFNLLDLKGTGICTVADLYGRYNPRSSPEYIKGSRSEEQLAEEFLSHFGGWNGNNARNTSPVTMEDFVSYYRGVSSTIEDDRVFDDMVRKAWRMDQSAYGRTGGSVNVSSGGGAGANRYGAPHAQTTLSTMQPGYQSQVQPGHHHPLATHRSAGNATPRYTPRGPQQPSVNMGNLFKRH